MKKTIDKLATLIYEEIDGLVIKLCKNLPLDFTLFERKGVCEKPNQTCDYCKKNNDTYFCNKKTYTLTREPRFT